MDNNSYNEILELFLKAVESVKSSNSDAYTEDAKKGLVPVGISNRHVHLTEEAVEVLFGKDYVLERIKNLSQPGQFACKECVTLCGPRGVIEKVRVLGPTRQQNQVEILAGDMFKLGLQAPLRQSGDLAESGGIIMVGPRGSVQIKEGVIVAQRHIHMNPMEAKAYGVHDGQKVKLAVDGPRAGIMDNVVVRADDRGALECHIDTEEANAYCINSKTKLMIIK